MAKKIVSRDEFLNAGDITTRDVAAPELGKDAFVRVRGASALEMDEYEGSLVTTVFKGDKAEVITNNRNAKARLVVKCVVDEDGDPVFKDADADALGRKRAGLINRLYDAIQDLSGTSRAQRDALEKNSVTAPGDCSATSSPDTSRAEHDAN